MILYNFEDFTLLKDAFPDLYYDEKSNTVKGEISFSAYYKNKGKKSKDKWVIYQCTKGDNCLQGYYEIEINLNTDIPTVREIGNKIINLAEKLRIPKEDLHIYSNSDKCCLGLGISQKLSLSKFIVNWVYPYFVWQAYFEKYRKKPPCGDYSHNRVTAEIEFLTDTLNKFKSLGANDLCPCGSEKKYKKCHGVKR